MRKWQVRYTYFNICSCLLFFFLFFCSSRPHVLFVLAIPRGILAYHMRKHRNLQINDKRSTFVSKSCSIQFLLQVNYMKRSSFDYITHLEFSSLALQIWKTLCKSLEGICNIPIGCCNIPILNFLFCSERCYWSIIFVSQLQRPEQNRTEQEVRNL
jgi:hypothetical protein